MGAPLIVSLPLTYQTPRATTATSGPNTRNGLCPSQSLIPKTSTGTITHSRAVNSST